MLNHVLICYTLAYKSFFNRLCAIKFNTDLRFDSYSVKYFYLSIVYCTNSFKNILKFQKNVFTTCRCLKFKCRYIYFFCSKIYYSNFFYEENK